MTELKEVIVKLIALFEELTGIEHMKLEAATQNRVATVEECMTREQALILKLKGLDKEREQVQKAAGYDGQPFSEILTRVSEEEKEYLEPIFEELSSKIHLFQDVSQDAAKVIEVNLHQIKKAVEIKEGGMYTEKGSTVNTEQHMTNRRV